MLIGVRGIFGVFLNFRDFLSFLVFEPPGGPNRLMLMPRGVGSTSTPADFLSGFFKSLKISDLLALGSSKF